MADDNEDVPDNIADEGEDDPSTTALAEAEAPPPPETPEPVEAPPPEKSTTSVKKSTTSVAKPEQSSASLKSKQSSKSVKSEGKIQDPEPTPEDEAPTEPEPEPTPAEPEPEPVPTIEVVPLGPLTEESQKACEYNPFILDKLFHEGSAGRLSGIDSAKAKAGAGGSTKYEDYQWQLEKLYRQVPEDMAVGPGRYKPDGCLYEGEKFVLGKLFRDLHEKDGYDPTAQREESAMNLADAIPVHIRTLPPEPCPRQYVMEVEASDNEKCVQFEPGNQMRYGTNPQSGKVFEYSYAPIMSVHMDSECDGYEGKVEDIPRPTTPHSCSVSKAKFVLEQEGLSSKPCPSCAAVPKPSCASSRATFPNNNVPKTCEGCGGPLEGTGAGASSASGKVCRNHLRCESNIQSVCQAARSAMAIYDTLTGCDNFPCNIGDKPEKELKNIEDGVWNWLYQVILKMIPKNSNDTAEALAAAVLNTIQEETANQEEEC